MSHPLWGNITTLPDVYEGVYCSCSFIFKCFYWYKGDVLTHMPSLLGAVTSGPAHFINVFHASFHVVQRGAYSEAVINCVLRFGLEVAGREATLAGEASGRLDGSDRRSSLVSRREVFGRTDVASISRRSIVGIIGTDGDGIGLATATIWHCGVADFNAGADVACTRVGGEEVWK